MAVRLGKPLISRDQVIRAVKASKKRWWGDAEVETTNRGRGCVVKGKNLDQACEESRSSVIGVGIADVFSHSSAPWGLQIDGPLATLTLTSCGVCLGALLPREAIEGEAPTHRYPPWTVYLCTSSSIKWELRNKGWDEAAKQRKRYKRHQFIPASICCMKLTACTRAGYHRSF